MGVNQKRSAKFGKLKCSKFHSNDNFSEIRPTPPVNGRLRKWCVHAAVVFARFLDFFGFIAVNVFTGNRIKLRQIKPFPYRDLNSCAAQVAVILVVKIRETQNNESER